MDTCAPQAAGEEPGDGDARLMGEGPSRESVLLAKKALRKGSGSVYFFSFLGRGRGRYMHAMRAVLMTP